MFRSVAHKISATKLLITALLGLSLASLGTASLAQANQVEVLVGPGGLTDPHQITGSAIQYASALAKLPDGSILIGNSQYPEPGASRVLKLARDGSLSVLVGPNGQVDPSATAMGSLERICGIAQLRDGSFVFADTNHDRIVKLDRDGRTLSVLIGGDGASINAQRATGLALDGPHGLVVRPNGALLIADWHSHRVLELSPDQTTLTVLVGPGGVVDPQHVLGQERMPEPFSPSGLELLRDGSLVIGSGEDGKNALELHPDNTLTILVGKHGPSYGQSKVKGPSSMSVRTDGRLLIAEGGWHGDEGRILELADDRSQMSVLLGPGGSVTTPAEVSSMAVPRTVLALSDNSMLVADTYNGRVLLVRPNDELDQRLNHLVSVGERMNVDDDLVALRQALELFGSDNRETLIRLWRTQNSSSYLPRLPIELVRLASEFDQTNSVSAGWRTRLSLLELERRRETLVPKWMH